MEELVNLLRYYAEKLYEDKQDTYGGLSNDVKEDFMLLKALASRLSSKVSPDDEEYSKWFEKAISLIREVENFDTKLSSARLKWNSDKYEKLSSQIEEKIAAKIDKITELLNVYVDRASERYKTKVMTVEEAKDKVNQEKKEKERLAKLEEPTPQAPKEEPTKTVVQPIEIPVLTRREREVYGVKDTMWNLLSGETVLKEVFDPTLEELDRIVGLALPSSKSLEIIRNMKKVAREAKGKEYHRQTIDVFRGYLRDLDAEYREQIS